MQKTSTKAASLAALSSPVLKAPTGGSTAKRVRFGDPIQQENVISSPTPPSPLNSSQPIPESSAAESDPSLDNDSTFFETINNKLNELGEKTNAVVGDLYSFCGTSPLVADFFEGFQQRLEARNRVVEQLVQEIHEQIENTRNLQGRLDLLQNSAKELVSSIFKMEP